jgi:hypothetical protein
MVIRTKMEGLFSEKTAFKKESSLPSVFFRAFRAFRVINLCRNGLGRSSTRRIWYFSEAVPYSLACFYTLFYL